MLLAAIHVTCCTCNSLSVIAGCDIMARYQLNIIIIIIIIMHEGCRNYYPLTDCLLKIVTYLSLLYRYFINVYRDVLDLKKTMTTW